MVSTVPFITAPTSHFSIFLFVSACFFSRAGSRPESTRRRSSSSAVITVTSMVFPSHSFKSSTYSSDRREAGIKPRIPSRYATAPALTTSLIFTLTTVRSSIIFFNLSQARTALASFFERTIFPSPSLVAITVAVISSPGWTASCILKSGSSLRSSFRITPSA